LAQAQYTSLVSAIKGKKEEKKSELLFRFAVEEM